MNCHVLYKPYEEFRGILGGNIVKYFIVIPKGCDIGGWERSKEGEQAIGWVPVGIAIKFHGEGGCGCGCGDIGG